MKKNILIVLMVFIGTLIILAPILYFILQKTQESKKAGPNPSEEYQKFINDKTITKIYSGVLPCDNCDGTEFVLSLSRESEDAKKGTFTISETYFGTSKDLYSFSGTWIFQQGEDGNVKGVYELDFSDEGEKKFEVINSENIVEIDQNGKRLQENGKDLVLTLLN